MYYALTAPIEKWLLIDVFGETPSEFSGDVCVPVCAILRGFSINS